jgi:hypothetical protein
METISLPEAIQNEVARLRETMAETKRLLPDARVSWVFYHGIINAAEKAVREQDTVTMIQLLPELKEMD